jgi:hypothetical protein
MAQGEGVPQAQVRRSSEGRKGPGDQGPKSTEGSQGPIGPCGQGAQVPKPNGPPVSRTPESQGCDSLCLNDGSH